MKSIEEKMKKITSAKMWEKEYWDSASSKQPEYFILKAQHEVFDIMQEICSEIAHSHAKVIGLKIEFIKFEDLQK